MSTNPEQTGTISFRHEHSINVLEIHIQLLHDEFEQAEAKAQQYINICAIVIAFISGISLGNAKFDDSDKLFLAILIGSFIYVFFMALRALNPRELARAISIEEQEKFSQFEQMVIKGNDLPYFEAVFATYKEVISINTPIIKDKFKYANLARYGVYAELLCALVLLIHAVWC